MRRIRQFFYILAIIIASPSALAVDLNHIFTRDDITRKPNRSDYSSDAAFAADSLVYAIPRTCRYVVTTGSKKRLAPWAKFNLGADLRKSPSSNWYANAASPIDITGSGRFSSFLYVNADTGTVACGSKTLTHKGGDWSSGGKWYKTFDLVLQTKVAQRDSSITDNIQSSLPDCLTVEGPWTNCFGTAIYNNGNEYVGEFKDRKPHGKGRHTTLDGRSVEGTWENGKIIKKTKVTPSAVTTKKKPEPSSQDKSVKTISFEEAQKQCALIGLKKGTEKFGNCVMKLMD